MVQLWKSFVQLLHKEKELLLFGFSFCEVGNPFFIDLIFLVDATTPHKRGNSIGQYKYILLMIFVMFSIK